MIVGLESGIHNADLEKSGQKKYNPETYKIWYNKNKEKKINYTKNYYKSHKEEKVLWAKEYRKRKPEVTLKTMLKTNYNLTVDQYNYLLLSQNNCCKICDLYLDKSTKSKTPHVDHCHKTGKVRGILCHQCNLNLGRIEKEGFLEKALVYLHENK